MNYIILDLEWNQANNPQDSLREMPFEVIDIGAIKLDQAFNVVDEFNRLVKPCVYTRMHYITGRILHLSMRELMKGDSFPLVMAQFLAWCGEDYIFCTWGPSDLAELQRNMRYHFLTPIVSGPFAYLDVQKLFSIAYEDTKARRSLEWAIDFLRIPKEAAFHRAIQDAYYTAKILAALPEGALKFYSYDTFILPSKRAEEIYVRFENYHKYISVEFANRRAAISDHEVMSTRCYLCEGRRNIKRRIKWFTTNNRHYHSVSFCPVHGYMKSKLRLKKTGEEGVYVVKTSKFIDEPTYLEMREKKNAAQKRVSS